MNTTWKKNIKPPFVCPKKYCFNWIEKGDYYAKGVFTNIEEADSAMKKASFGHCNMGFTCKRINPKGQHDFYEPCEPFLERDGLPWFYFIPGPEKVNSSMKGEYIEESEILWGKDHWKNNG